jgi:hypothetical protein
MFVQFSNVSQNQASEYQMFTVYYFYSRGPNTRYSKNGNICVWFSKWNYHLITRDSKYPDFG